jgi:hypothetical protein
MADITVLCTKPNHNASQFRKTDEEVDDDGAHILVKQYWAADCGCEVEVTLVLPRAQTDA